MKPRYRYRLSVALCGLQRLEADGTLTPLDPVDSSYLLESFGLAEWLPITALTRRQYAGLKRLEKMGIYPIYEAVIRRIVSRRPAHRQVSDEPDPRLEALRREAYRDRLTALAERGWATSDDRDDLNYAWLFSDTETSQIILALAKQLDAAERVELSQGQREAIRKICDLLR